MLLKELIRFILNARFFVPVLYTNIVAIYFDLTSSTSTSIRLRDFAVINLRL